ncbi:hypothetical protein bAD24_p00610 (plasmid) [Burkholderia sp. AD24]|nr:hypothetical protein bAD24_p00610 [Burkholderia sp. AD24]
MDTTMIREYAGCDCSCSAQGNAALAKAPEHTFEVFFYGLNMDAGLLSSKGVVPRDPRLALIEGQVVVLGAKAMLLRSLGGRAYGMMFRLTHQEMDTLYAGMHDYRPEPFTAILVNPGEDSRPVAAISMVHLDPPVDSKHDSAYCARWINLVRRLGIADLMSAGEGSKPFAVLPIEPCENE